MGDIWQLDVDCIENRACISLIQPGRTWLYFRYGNGAEAICYYQEGYRFEIFSDRMQEIYPDVLEQLRRKWDAIQIILGH